MTAARRGEPPWMLRTRVIAGWLGFELVTLALGVVVWSGVLWLTTVGLAFALVAGSRGEP